MSPKGTDTAYGSQRNQDLPHRDVGTSGFQQFLLILFLYTVHINATLLLPSLVQQLQLLAFSPQGSSRRKGANTRKNKSCSNEDTRVKRTHEASFNKDPGQVGPVAGLAFTGEGTTSVRCMGRESRRPDRGREQVHEIASCNNLSIPCSWSIYRRMAKRDA